MPALTPTELETWNRLPAGEYIARFQVQTDGSTSMRLIHKPTQREIEVYKGRTELNGRKKDNGA